MALRLTAALSHHGVPADIQPYRSADGEALVSVWLGLLVRTNERRIRWIIPGTERRRGKPLWTWAREPDNAAARLAEHYRQLRDQPVHTTILGGPLLADAFLDDALRKRDATPR
ncbi:hypothetical protein FHR32_006316 [Streptosporangium album]|uniref:Uncharacterized protein n=1 Tax=Streptosporangium album TaxID=47479 RepID=A0A7W7S193_9ACTN|nr:hypothetical protein [Streptosporangium album]MBB4941930.1 hypothetical protein [Streptosporangium album]